METLAQKASEMESLPSHVVKVSAQFNFDVNVRPFVFLCLALSCFLFSFPCLSFSESFSFPCSLAHSSVSQLFPVKHDNHRNTLLTEKGLSVLNPDDFIAVYI